MSETNRDALAREIMAERRKFGLEHLMMLNEKALFAFGACIDLMVNIELDRRFQAAFRDGEAQFDGHPIELTEEYIRKELREIDVRLRAAFDSLGTLESGLRFLGCEEIWDKIATAVAIVIKTQNEPAIGVLEVSDRLRTCEDMRAEFIELMADAHDAVWTVGPIDKVQKGEIV